MAAYCFSVRKPFSSQKRLTSVTKSRKLLLGLRLWRISSSMVEMKGSVYWTPRPVLRCPPIGGASGKSLWATLTRSSSSQLRLIAASFALALRWALSASASLSEVVIIISLMKISKSEAPGAMVFVLLDDVHYHYEQDCAEDDCYVFH